MRIIDTETVYTIPITWINTWLNTGRNAKYFIHMMELVEEWEKRNKRMVIGRVEYIYDPERNVWVEEEALDKKEKQRLIDLDNETIPIKWIKSKINVILDNYPNGNEETEILCKLLYEWEKENEAN